MKGLLLALGAAALTFLLATVMFRFATLERRAPALLGVFLATVLPYLAGFAWTPADLGVLPAPLVERRAVLECAFGLAVHAALFFGGLLQLYNLAERGFSLRILIDIEESRGRALSADEVLRGYGGGRGLGWMLDKRIRGILDHGYVRLEAGRYRNTPKGDRAARTLGALRSYLRLDPAR